MALYVTRLKYRKVNGVNRPYPTSLLYGDTDWETVRAELFCELRPARRIATKEVLALELGWFDYHRIISYGALLCDPWKMAETPNVCVG